MPAAVAVSAAVATAGAYVTQRLIRWAAAAYAKYL